MALVRGTERFEQSTLPMALVGLDGTVHTANRALARLLGRAVSELDGCALVGLAASETGAASLRAQLALAVAGEPAEADDVELAAADGSVPCRTYWTVVRGQDGRPGYLTLVVVDETERLRAEHELAAQTARWQALLRGAAHITYTADADGRLTWATTSFGRLLGWRREDLADLGPADLVHPEDQVAAAQAWAEVAQGRAQQTELELRVRRRDGEYVWVRHTLSDLRDEPAVRALVGNAVDVTEQRRVRAEAEHHQQRFHARFARSTVPQAFVGPDGRLTDVNDAFCALVDRPREELVGRPVTELNADADTGEADAVLREVLTGQRVSAQVERVMVGPAGRPVSVLIDVTGMRDQQGRPDGAAAYLHDLTSLHDAQRRQERQEEFFLALSARAADAAIVTDEQGRIVHASPSLAHVLGHGPFDLVGELAMTLVHPEDQDAVRTTFRDVQGQVRSGATTLRVLHADGSWRWVEMTVSNLVDTAVGGIVANLKDITERVAAETALRASEARYRTLIDTAQEGIWAAGLDGRTLYANARAAELLGVPLQEVLDRPLGALLDRDTATEFLSRLATRAERGAERYEIPFAHPDGTSRTYSIAASPLLREDGSVEGALAMIADVTAARQAQEELRHAALHDALTGLANRTLLQDRLAHALQRQTVGTAVLFLDLDQFKLVNDSRGHDAGDQLLVQVAERLRSALRPEDTVARFGGDEFVVVCEDTDEAQARQVADDLMGCLEEPLLVDGDEVHINASIGVAVTPTGSAGDLLRFADTAMYAAKGAGRGRVHVYDRRLSEEVEQRHVLVAQLRAALHDGGLDMHYQPVVDLGTGRVVGVEALARWTSPDLGPVPPSRFVAVADSAGLSPELDRWALGRALRDAAALRADGRLPADAHVAVNLSARNLADPALVDLVVEAAAASGTPASLVALEITESAVMGDAERSVETLRTLRNRGFQVLVDDFGTGYSSLAYLRDLPITGLKVDRSFVQGIADDADALAIVASVVDLAHAVAVRVVAEGVETEQQAALLREMGCEAAQGWLWSAAVPAAELRVGGWPAPAGLLPVRSSRPRRQVRRTTTLPPGPEHGLDRLLELHRSGASLASIAAALNSERFRTPEGVRWHRTTVARAVAATAYPSLLEPEPPLTA